MTVKRAVVGLGSRRGMTREFCLTTADLCPGLLSVPHQKREREGREHGGVSAAVRFQDFSPTPGCGRRANAAAGSFRRFGPGSRVHMATTLLDR